MKVRNLSACFYIPSNIRTLEYLRSDNISSLLADPLFLSLCPLDFQLFLVSVRFRFTCMPIIFVVHSFSWMFFRCSFIGGGRLLVRFCLLEPTVGQSRKRSQYLETRWVNAQWCKPKDRARTRVKPRLGCS